MESFESASTVERHLIAQAQRMQSPINGSLELLPLCNMNCDMCYVRLDRKSMEAQGRIRTAEEWLEIGEQMQKAGVLFMLLTGGEPLLHPGFKEIYLGLHKLGMILTINTNATLIDETWVKFFAEHPPRRINITMYGSSRETYDRLCHYPDGYEKVTNAICMLKEAGLMVKVALSAARNNEADLDRIMDFAESQDCAISCDTYMMAASRERQKPFEEQARLDAEAAAAVRVRFLQRELKAHFTEYALGMTMQVDDWKEEREAWEADGTIVEHKVPGKVSCLAGSCSFTINWQGEMRPCVIFTEPAVNVFEEDFASAWKQIRAGVDQIQGSPECTVCEYRALCRTCPAAGKYEEGDSRIAPKYLCDYTKETDRLLRAWLQEHPEEVEQILAHAEQREDDVTKTKGDERP